MAFAVGFPTKHPTQCRRSTERSDFAGFDMTRPATVHGRSLSALEIPAIN
jgi:hypothetical protein